MKFRVLALATITAVVTPKAELANHDSDHNIPAIDEMIISYKQDYINKCYMPIVKKNPPENACQAELFQMLERSYHLDYNQNHVAMASNKLLFKDIDAKIIEMSRNDPEVRNAIRAGAFTSTSGRLHQHKRNAQLLSRKVPFRHPDRAVLKISHFYEREKPAVEKLRALFLYLCPSKRKKTQKRQNHGKITLSEDF